MKIHDAARSRDIAGVARELAAGVDVDCLEKVSGYTALQIVSGMPNATLEIIQFLVGFGAHVSQEVFHAAVQSGSLETLRYYLQSGARVDIREEGGCGTLIYAAYGRNSPIDTSLIPVLKLLIEHGADVNIVSSYSESALRILSNQGRFDAVQFLLEHGADSEMLEWTDLMFAVALGTIKEVEALLMQGALLTNRDFWERTPWLLSLQVGILSKAQLLLAAGADRNDRGRCGKTPLVYAVEARHLHILEWLLTEGFEVNATDDFGTTALLSASEWGYADCVSLLLHAGADSSKGTSFSHPITDAPNFEVVRLLVAAGEDLSQMNDEVRRELTGTVPGDLRATREEYLTARHRQFGRSNPQRIDNAFWHAMVHCGCNAYRARVTYEETFSDTGRWGKPVWCYERFGRTTTLLPDGRIVEIAGEHEDSCDPDLCIYNDVVVFDGKGNFEIWGYPEQIFPPTDFHSATLVGDYLYLIGNLGYARQRRPGETPIYRLDCRTFQIQFTGDLA